VRSRSLLWSFDYAIRGIVYALRTQRNMRLHIGAAVIVLVAALILRVTGLELVALLFAVGLVVVAELANTALEAAVDLATENFDPMAAVAKDVAAGAVLVASLTSVAVGYVIFIGRLAPVAQTAMDSARTTSTAVTLIAVVLTGVLVLVMKAVTHEPGTSFMHGGWPSGHTAIAFATAAAIGYSVDSAKAMILALFIALLVGQSRVESGTHTVPQAVAGAVLGFLLTTAAFQLFWK
jgi:diacylglycerol kinase (ATP)